VEERFRFPDFTRSSAVLIATGAFNCDPDLRPLPAVRNNVQSLHSLLTNASVSGFTEKRCTTVLDPPEPDSLFRPVKEAADSARDLLLVYYSGHGIINQYDGELHLALTETVQDDAWTSASVKALAGLIKKSRAICKIIILDCCFSGRALDQLMGDPAQVAANQLDIDGIYAIASSSASKPSFSDDAESYTRFTGGILSIIESGVPNAGQSLSMDDLFNAVRAKVRPVPQQRVNNNAGHVALVRNRAYRESGVISAPISELDHTGSAAVLVGTTTYSDEHFNPLPSCSFDLALMTQVLTDPDICGVPADRVAKILNPNTFGDVLEPLQQLSRDVYEVVFMYLTGHLILDPRGEPHLALGQSHSEKPWTWLPMSFITDTLHASRARSTLIIADTCFAGRISRSFAGASGISLLAACPSNSMAVTQGDGSVFTKKLAAMLRRGLPSRPIHLTLLDIFQGMQEIDDEYPEPTLSTFGLRELHCLFKNRSPDAYTGFHSCGPAIPDANVRRTSR
jgi:hypothetical protein